MILLTNLKYIFFCKLGDDDADADHDRFSPIPMLQIHRIVYSPRYLVSDPPLLKNWTVYKTLLCSSGSFRIDLE